MNSRALLLILQPTNEATTFIRQKGSWTEPVIARAIKRSFSILQIQREYHLPRGDFPNVDYFREVLQGYQISNFNKLNPKLLKNVDDVLGIDIPDLLHKFRNPYD